MLFISIKRSNFKLTEEKESQLSVYFSPTAAYMPTWYFFILEIILLRPLLVYFCENCDVWKLYTTKWVCLGNLGSF